MISRMTQMSVTMKSNRFQLLAQNAQKCSVNFSRISSTNIANTVISHNHSPMIIIIIIKIIIIIIIVIISQQATEL